MMICPQCGGREFTVVEILCQRIEIRCNDEGGYGQTRSPRFMHVEAWDSVTCRGCDQVVDEGAAVEVFDTQHPELYATPAPTGGTP